MKKKIEIAKPEIVSVLNNTGKSLFKKTELLSLLRNHREVWGLAQYTKGKDFINFLIDNSDLKKVTLDFPSRRETRYMWKNTSDFELALSLNTKAYLSHYTAVFIHELTEQIPKSIYVNIEQTPKPKNIDPLQQERIDYAFRQKIRETKNKAKYLNKTITVISGKQTNQLGVIKIPWENNVSLRVSNIERTLIDICVRPIYAGGIFEVLNAYRKARNTASIASLVEILKKLDYIYPYQQAIGFYLEKAGYEKKQLQLLKEFDNKNDFFLTHGMKELEYSDKWRLFFPKGF